jgi:AcrR family transcriptional regulator
MPGSTGLNKPRRRYQSPQRKARARQTRQRILEAATALLLTGGYAATSIRAIADAANVSVPAVELAFASKPRLLKAAIDLAIAGDDQPVPMLERDWAARALATSTAAELLKVFGSVLQGSMRRSAPLVVAAFELADSDPGMRVVADELAEQRSKTVSWLVDALLERAALRPGFTREAAVDTVWMLMDPVVFQRLSRYRGQTPDGYVAWFAEVVRSLFA